MNELFRDENERIILMISLRENKIKYKKKKKRNKL